VPKFTVLAQAL